MAVLCFFANAQQKQKSAVIGDYVPDIPFKKILYYDSKELKLADLRGKWVLIDCWSAVCIPCIKGLPEVDSLQRLYPENLQVLLVTSPVFYKPNQTQTTSHFPDIETIFNRIAEKQGYALHLPCALMEPKEFTKTLPYKFVPQYFIIDPDGRLEAITSSTSMAIAIIHTAMRELSLTSKNPKLQ